MFGRIGNSWRAVPGWSAVSEDPRSSACAPWPTAVRELHDPKDRTAIAERKRGDDTHPKGRDNLLARFMSGAAIAHKSTRSIIYFPRTSMLLLCRHIMLRVSWDTIQGPWTKHLVLALR